MSNKDFRKHPPRKGYVPFDKARTGLRKAGIARKQREKHKQSRQYGWRPHANNGGITK